jgi:hypothetical protein
MKAICIPPAAQMLAGAALLGGAAALLATNAPEIQRYLKLRGM